MPLEASSTFSEMFGPAARGLDLAVGERSLGGWELGAGGVG